jgi:hypothetical protein
MLQDIDGVEGVQTSLATSGLKLQAMQKKNYLEHPFLNWFIPKTGMLLSNGIAKRFRVRLCPAFMN